jgi:alanine racemase
MLTFVEIDAKAFHYNLKTFRSLIPKSAEFMAVIKGNAYGHGFLQIAKLVEESREVDTLCVANLSEALELIRSGYTRKPILILSFYELDEEKITKAARSQTIFPLYTIEQAAFLNRIGKQIGGKIHVHLKIDTGTSRIGILPQEAIMFVQKVQKYKQVIISGAWTHLAASEIDSERTKKQLRSFEHIRERLEVLLPHMTLWHSNCTAATVLHPEGAGKGERVGIGLYGLQPSELTRKKVVLKPVLSWKTKLIQVKKVPKGTRISYDGTYITKRETILGVLPVGYYDGFDRRLSNRGKVLVGGRLCPVLGRVCMNLTMIDVTEVPKKPKTGQEVVIIGKQGRAEITADDVAAWCNTINYEIVDRINPLLPRIVQ